MRMFDEYTIPNERLERMIKMRRIIVVILLCAGGFCDGAYFDYYDGGLYTFCEVYSEDASYYDGPYSDVNEGISYSAVEGYAEVPDAYSYASSTVWDTTDEPSHSVCLRFNSFGDVSESDENCYGFGYGYSSTEDEYTYGIFYEILPQAGEQTGDDVIVYCTASMKISAWGQTYAYVGGPGDMNYIAITRGQQPPVADEPNSEYEVWIMDNLELTDESFDGYMSTETFKAKVGDVIGVFAENYADITGQGPLDGLIEGDLTIILTIETVLAGDLDGDDDVDMFDLAVLAKNWLKGT